MAPEWENLDEFLDPGEFGTWALISRPGGQARRVAGIYDDPYLAGDLGQYTADTSQPRFTCKAEDVVDVARGDTVLIGRQVYDVLSAPQGDGTGIAVIELAAQEMA